MENFSQYLNKLLSEKGISQNSFAATVGVSRATVGKWARGETLPTNKFVAKISSVLNVAPEEIETFCNGNKTYNDAFCENLRLKLRDNGISQKDFATNINVAPSLVSMWLNGSAVPSYKLKKRILDFLQSIETNLNQIQNFSEEKTEIETVFLQLNEVMEEILNIHKQAKISAEKIKKILDKKFYLKK